MTLLSLVGPSCAGKSSLAKHLEQQKPGIFARVPVDYFFVPRGSDVPLAAFLTRPLEYRWDLIDRMLDQPPPRSTPQCDFTRMRHVAPAGGLPIAVAAVYVLDGMRPHPRSDIVICLELDQSTQRDRLQRRDRLWGTELFARREHLDRTFAADEPRSPNVILDATEPLEANALRVINLLTQTHPQTLAARSASR